MIYNFFFIPIILLCMLSCSIKQPVKTDLYPFRIENLVPWSIVAFDNQDRNHEERVEMVQRLGFQQYAFGGKDKHLATMQEEWLLAKERGIKITAVWLWLNHHKDEVGKLKPKSESIFKALKESGLETQIWLGFDKDFFKGLSDKTALEESIKWVDYLCKRADSIQCKIALYNHGGWIGEPENQVKIIQALPQHKMGIIYNFHHGHEQLERYPQILELINPYLWCVNLNGMKAEGPKIMTIGSGDLEKQMIETLLETGYKGSFGILGHVKGGDAEAILKQNTEGLYHLFPR